MDSATTKIHHTAMRILAEFGVRIGHPEVLALFQDHGIRVSGDRVFFTENQVMDWVGMAPAEFTLHARNPRYNMVIGGERTECAPGYGCPAIIAADGTRRRARLADYQAFAKLVHQSAEFNINGGILAQPTDVDAAHSHLAMLYTAARCSDKCLMGVPGHAAEIETAMGMLAILFGGMASFTEKPHVLTMISTISPLVIDGMALDSILVCARHNQPLMISPAPTAGSTGPIELAGNVALGTAEALAGIAVAQMVKPGVPVLFGLQCNGADLRTANISIGSPVYALLAGHCARLARHYGLPSRAGGATTDAPALTVQSGYESMFSLFSGFENRINLMVHCAGILDRYAGMSYEQFMVDIELIRMARFYRQGIAATTDDDLGFEVIRDVGPGGQFLTHPDTLRKCRTHSWIPAFGSGRAPAHEKPGDKLLAEIQARCDKMLAGYRRPALAPEIQHDLDAFLTDRGMDPGTLQED